MKAEIYAINKRIPLIGWDKDELEEHRDLMRTSIGQTIRGLYRERVQIAESTEKGLMIFNVQGEEVGRVQYYSDGVSCRIMHPEMSLDDLYEGNKMSIERAQKFLRRISA